MSTAQLTVPRASLPAEQPGARSGVLARAPAALAGGLLAVILYAAFAHGAVALAADTRVQLAITVLALLGLIAWLWTGSLRLAATRTAWIATGLMLAFAVWCGVTVLWSVAPDHTWLEVNRVLTYAVVLLLAMAVSASHRKALELVSGGFLAVALLVTVYALGQKVFPALHVPGLFNLNQAGPLPRLQEPLGYWNALGVFIAMAVPLALALACDRDRSPRTRIYALCAMELMVLTIVFTYSRGALLALAVALAALILLSGNRLRSAMWLGAVAVATAPATAVGLALPQLNHAGVQLSSRGSAGAVLAAVVAVSLAGLVFAARKLMAVEPRVSVGPDRLPAVRRLAVGALAGILVALVLVLSFSSRGLGGTVSHAWHTFTATKAASNYDPNRLLSADSENRWVWWKEATGAFADRPLGGWGAGSFAAVHLLYRHDNLSVQQPHSVPLQFLSETGIVGALLALSAMVLLLWVAVRRVRERPGGPERMVAAGLLAAGVLYAVHSLYDWDWEIPAVTLPALLFLGALAGARSGAAQSSDVRWPNPGPGPRAQRGGHGVWLAVLSLWLAVLGLSIEVPNLAAARASSALVQASASTPADLQQAQVGAAAAAALDPLSDAGLLVESTVALHRGQLVLARRYLQQAAARNPSDVNAWSQLAYLDAMLHDQTGSDQAAQAVLDLDPRGLQAQSLMRARLLLTPPGRSATRFPTALPGS